MQSIRAAAQGVQEKNKQKPEPAKTAEYEGSNVFISSGSTLLDLAISGGRVRGGGIPGGILVEVPDRGRAHAGVDAREDVEDLALAGEILQALFAQVARNQLERTYAGLAGLPVAFVRRHERDIAEALQGDVQRQWVVKNYGLHVTPSLSLGEDTAIDLTSQTAFYDIRGGAYIDAGRDHSSDEDTVLMAHLGRKIGSHHEIYGAVKFMPSSLDWNFIPGYFYRFAGVQKNYYAFAG